MPDSTYAPQSPDLSSFQSSSTPPRTSQTSSYTPRSPNLRAFASNLSHQHPHRSVGSLGGLGLGHGELLASKLSPQQQQKQQQQKQQQQHQHQQPHQPQQHLPLQQPHQLQQQQPRYIRYGVPQDPYQPAPPPPPPPAAPHQNKYRPPAVNPPPPALHVARRQPPIQPANASAGVTTVALTPLKPVPVVDPEPRPVDMAGRGRRQAAAKADSSSNTTSPSTAGPSHAGEVKTKFPVARIKRIMQADEEVGKVAQVTPVAVSKALELFMISLVTKSADVAKAASSKRVTAQHLKKAIAADDQFDFLTDIVSRVVDGPSDSAAAAAKRAKDDDDSDEDSHKAVKKAKGRRKKGE